MTNPETAPVLLWYRRDLRVGDHAALLAVADQPLRPGCARLPTRDRTAPAEPRAWHRGRTGVPVVDAGVRQLWHIGLMPDRVRMVAAWLLVKHLRRPWQAREAWVRDTLADADMASNALGWPWTAGSGIGAQPSCRVFDPVFQGSRLDPAGACLRRWVPELAKLPDRFVHASWTASAFVLGAAEVRLGTTYPRPLVALGAGCRHALGAFCTAVRGADTRGAAA